MTNTPQTFLSHDEMLAIAIGDEIAVGGYAPDWLPVFKVTHHTMSDGRTIVYVNVGREGFDLQRAFPTDPAAGGSLARDRYRKGEPDMPNRNLNFRTSMDATGSELTMAYAERTGALKAQLETLISSISMAARFGKAGIEIAERDAEGARALLDQLRREADDVNAQRMLRDMPDRRSA